jgi:hypothetical protein
MVTAAPVPYVYCVDAREAEGLIAEMRADAGDGLLAVDFETTPKPRWAAERKELALAEAALAGKISARTQVKAPPAEIAALKKERKLLKARLEYAEGAALDPRRGRVRLVQLYGGGARAIVVDIFRTGEDVCAAWSG